MDDMLLVKTLFHLRLRSLVSFLSSCITSYIVRLAPHVCKCSKRSLGHLSGAFVGHRVFASACEQPFRLGRGDSREGALQERILFYFINAGALIVLPVTFAQGSFAWKTPV